MKTEEQRAEEQKAMVDSMRLAQKNMQAALNRIEELERALKSAASNLSSCASMVAPNAYSYGGKEKLKDQILGWEADARKRL